MLKIFQRISDSFNTRGGKKDRPVPEGLTRRVLVERIFDEFIQQMQEEESEYQLLFPASFTIYLSPSDFERRKSGFPFTVKELVNRFNAEIRRKMSAGHSDYIGHSQFWYFKFNSFPEEATLIVGENEISSLPPGEVLILCDLVPEDGEPVKSPTGGRVVKTVVDKNPVIPTGAINRKAVTGGQQAGRDGLIVHMVGSGSAAVRGRLGSVAGQDGRFFSSPFLTHQYVTGTWLI